MSVSYHRAAALAHGILIAACLAELAVLTLGTWVWYQEGRQPSVTIWLIRTLPVLVFVPGVVRGRLNSCIWLCFVMLLYFAMAVTNTMSPHRTWLNGVELLMSVLIFTSGMFFVRWRARALKEQVQ